MMKTPIRAVNWAGRTALIDADGVEVEEFADLKYIAQIFNDAVESGAGEQMTIG